MDSHSCPSDRVRLNQSDKVVNLNLYAARESDTCGDGRSSRDILARGQCDQPAFRFCLHFLTNISPTGSLDLVMCRRRQRRILSINGARGKRKDLDKTVVPAKPVSTAVTKTASGRRRPEKATPMSTQCGVELIRIVSMLAGTADEDSAQELENHLEAGCVQCDERIASIEQYAEVPTPPSDARQMDAQPLLDTQLVQPRTSGVRGGATLVRRRVYEAEGRICIDIQQREVEPGSSVLEGQVLLRGGGLDDIADSLISLWSEDRRVGTAKVDALGDFTISEVPQGCYDLTVELDGANVILRGIEI